MLPNKHSAAGLPVRLPSTHLESPRLATTNLPPQISTTTPVEPDRSQSRLGVRRSARLASGYEHNRQDSREVGCNRAGSQDVAMLSVQAPTSLEPCTLRAYQSCNYASSLVNNPHESVQSKLDSMTACAYSILMASPCLFVVLVRCLVATT